MKKLVLMCLLALSVSAFAGHRVQRTQYYPNAVAKSVNVLEPTDTIDITDAIDEAEASYQLVGETHNFTLNLMDYIDGDPTLSLSFVAQSATKIAGVYTSEDVLDLTFSQLTYESSNLSLTYAYLVIEYLGEDAFGDQEYNIQAKVVANDNKMYIYSGSLVIYAYNSDTMDDIELNDVVGPVTALNQTQIQNVYARDGRVYCEEAFHIYDMLGCDVTLKNGALNGAYVVRVGEQAQKVVVK